MRAKRRRRLEDAVRRAADLLDRADHADEVLRLVVVGREILVADRPVEAEAVDRLRHEVVVGEAQRYAAVVVRASAEDPRAEPREVAAGRDGVRFAVELRAAVRRAVREAGPAARVGLALRARAAMRHVIGQHVLLEVRHVQHRPCFEEEHRDAEIGEHLGGGAAARAGSDDHDVMNRVRSLRHV